MPIGEAVFGTMDVNGGIQVDQPDDSQRPPTKTTTFCASFPDDPLQKEFSYVTCPALPLCLGCNNRHVARMQGHEAIPLEESSEIMCAKHPDKKIEFFIARILATSLSAQHADCWITQSMSSVLCLRLLIERGPKQNCCLKNVWL